MLPDLEEKTILHPDFIYCRDTVKFQLAVSKRIHPGRAVGWNWGISSLKSQKRTFSE